MNKINHSNLSDIAELKAILNLHDKAKKYLEEFDWCIKIKKSWYDKDFSIYEKTGVFLFEIVPLNDQVDDLIWVIAGDMPSVYLDKSIITSKQALITYCDLMQEWIDNVQAGKSLDECYPILVESTYENADLLNKRIVLIKQELLLRDDK